MDGILTDGRAGKLWMCKRNDGHALGIILSGLERGDAVERLLLFRETFAPGGDFKGKTLVLPLIKTMGLAEGTVHDIECEICGAKRTWWIDKKIAINLIMPLHEGGKV